MVQNNVAMNLMKVMINVVSKNILSIMIKDVVVLIVNGRAMMVNV